MRFERVSWIDICKGIGIILVIYGHALSGHTYRYLIYAFHMPLFFFLSGVVFHHKKYEHFFPFVKKSVQRIMIPYFLFAFISFGIALVNAKNPFSSAALNQFIGIFYGNGATGGLAFNVVLWFLPCLFIARITFAIITAHITKKSGIVLVLVLFSIIGFFFAQFFPRVKLPLGAETALTAVVFFGAGYLWNDRSEKINAFFQKYLWVFFGIFLIALYFVASTNFVPTHQQIDMRLNRFHNYFYFYIAAFSGIFAVVSAAMLVKKNIVLEKLGKYSMILFIWHLIVFSYFTRFIRLFLDAKTVDALRDTYFSPLYTIFSILVIFSFVYVWRKLKPLLAYPRPLSDQGYKNAPE